MELLIKIESPAPFFEARALFEQHAHLKPLAARAATLQLAAAKTYGLCLAARSGPDRPLAARLLVVIGLWPHPDRTEELFVVGRPGDELAPFMHRLASATRLILRWRLQGGTRSIVALVRSENEAGHRLARLGGFPFPAEPAGRFVRYQLRKDARRAPASPAG